ncbi:DUF262 domain-containing protein [Nocardia sp. NBC_01377]|uniref:DUF262 domain-containing protein n=1 Tax=Nocardia sp. NBC_01377 TaxID=2903595 RepID=UPI0032432E08
MAGADESVAEDFGGVVEEVFYGEPTGVELETAFGIDDDVTLDDFLVDGDDQRRPPWDPEEIRVSTRSFSLRNVLDMIGDDDLELAPDFQRNRVWKSRQKSRLIESLLLQIPLPAFYFAADSDGKFRVVDGLQRLSTVHEFVQGAFDLGDLEYLYIEHGKKFQDLSAPLRRRLLNSQISVHIIEPSTPNRVKYDIFKRLNTGGEPLNAMEIRHCMSESRSRDLLKRCAASPAFIEATGSALLNHIRMHDREAALRFLAFRRLGDISKYANFGSLEDLLDQTAWAIDQPDSISDSQLEVWFADFERAMVNANIIFGDRAFRKWPKNYERRSPFNRALFESWGVALADYEAERVLPVRARIVELAREAMADYRPYIDSISTSTASPGRIRLRFQLPRVILQGTIA